jgi:hypothetical protein
VNDAARPETASFANDGAVEHHHLSCDVNRRTNLAADQRGLRPNETVLADLQRDSGSIPTASRSQQGAWHDHSPRAELDRRARGDNHRTVIDDAPWPDPHVARDQGR